MGRLLLSGSYMPKSAASMCVFRHFWMSCSSTCEVNRHWFVTERFHALKEAQNIKMRLNYSLTKVTTT